MILGGLFCFSSMVDLRDGRSGHWEKALEVSCGIAPSPQRPALGEEPGVPQAAEETQIAVPRKDETTD